MADQDRGERTVAQGPTLEEARSLAGGPSIFDLTEGPSRVTHERTERSTSASARASDRVQIGDRLGRYLVLARLGAGSSGVVLAAYDPELDRRLAIKLLRRRSRKVHRQRERLRREAQALAKLDHPNVVTIYDVGLHEEQVFIAMEFVDGRTLGGWMLEAEAPSRSWRDILRVFESAARGLAAAHELGLVHRDFKPDNVMLGKDGRVRVMDFGLVRFDTEDSSREREEAEEEAARPSADDSRTKLTRTGAFIGTPAYMSPEQFGKREVTARSDQFSFCVALFEALYGLRPFAGTNVDELRESVLRQALRPVPHNSPVPTWLHRVLLRGLSLEPDARYPTMGALLEAIEAGERGRRRRRGVLAGALAALSLGASLGAIQVQRHRVESACRSEGESIRAVWNESTPRELSQALAAAGVADADALLERVTPWLDRHALAWSEHAAEACRETRVDARWSAAEYQAVRWCLEDRRFELEILVEDLGRTQGALVSDVVMAAAELAPVRACFDRSVRATTSLPAPELQPRLVEARKRLSRGRYLLAAGRYDDALLAARSLREDAEGLEWPPLLLDIRALEATALERTDAFEEAERTALAVYVEAASAGQWETAVAASQELIDIVGFDLARPREGEVWAEHTRVAIARAGDPLGLREAERSMSLGTLLADDGRGALAVEHFRHALELRAPVLGEDHPRVGDVHFVLGAAHASAGQYDAGKASCERAMAIYAQTLGTEHPYVAAVLHQLGEIGQRGERFADARDALERAVALQIRTLGDDHLEVAKTWRSIAGLETKLGNFEAARQRYAQALAIAEAVVGTEHPEVARILLGAAQVEAELGNFERAVEQGGRALEALETTRGTDHAQLVEAKLQLARIQASGGSYPEALKLTRTAVELSTRLEDDVLLARARLAYASLSWDAPPDAGGDRLRAMEQVELARRELAGKHHGAQTLAELERWLDEHRFAKPAIAPARTADTVGP